MWAAHENTFGEVLNGLKQGFCADRKGWNRPGMYIGIQFPDENSKMTQPYIFMYTATGDLVPWLASQTDMLTNDWRIMVEDRY